MKAGFAKAGVTQSGNQHLDVQAESLARGAAMASRTKRIATRKIKSKGRKSRNKSLRKGAVKRTAPKKAKKVAKKTTKKLARKARRGGVTRQTRARKPKQSLRPAAGPVETAVIEVIEKPVPGVATVTEFEAVSIAERDSNEENER